MVTAQQLQCSISFVVYRNLPSRIVVLRYINICYLHELYQDSHVIFLHIGSKRKSTSLGKEGVTDNDDDDDSPSHKIAPIINKLNENRSKLMSMFSELDKYKCGKVLNHLYKCIKIPKVLQYLQFQKYTE